MRISMIPSNDVKTIHASQDDTQREWCFEPFDNSGTLIIGEESLANIMRIKGNTLAFNQLVQNGNFASTSGWQNNSWDSFTVSGNVGKIVATGVNRGAYITVDLIQGHKYLWMAEVNSSQPMNVGINELGGRVQTTVTNQYITVSKVATASASGSKAFALYSNSSSQNTMNVRNCMLIDLTLLNASYITDYNSFKSYFPLPYYSYQSTLLPFKGTGIKTVGKNRLNYDVWKTVETRNGTSVWENNGVTITATGNDAYTLYGASSFPVNARVPVRVGESITLSWESDDNVNGDVYIFPNGGSAGFVQINNRYGKSLSYTPVDGVEYVTFRFGVASSGNTIHYKNIMIRFADTDSTFEPYTSSMTDLPTLTYFPNGMKSAGNVYDELLPTKAITRLVKYTITGTESVYEWSQGYNNHYGGSLTLPSSISRICKGGTNTNGIASRGYNVAFANNNMTVYLNTNADRIIIINDAYTTQAQWLQGITGLEVVLELATPTETDINTEVFYPVYQYGTEQILPINGANPTTSPFVGDIYYADGLKTDQTFLYRQTPINYNARQFALVSKNTETPLTLKDGKGYCNSPLALTNESGFFDAKLKMTDSDGVCYSEKFQIHVERRP